MQDIDQKTLNNDPEKVPLHCALAIAGSDSGGGAGIQADLRTFAFSGVFGTSAITAITGQNPLGVKHIMGLPPETVEKQISAVTEVFDLKAVKTGMLFSAEIMEKISPFLAGFSCPVVTDPVMVSTSGKILMQKDSLNTFLEKILPFATFITPNIPETEVLTGKKICNFTDCIESAKECAEKFHCGVIVKGGHAEGEKSSSDVAVFREECIVLQAERCMIPVSATHGTGCTLSSAFAAFLAKGYSWKEALREAKAFVLASLEGARPFSGTQNLAGMWPPDPEQRKKAAEKIICIEM